MQLQVELDLRKSVLFGFLHKMENQKLWIQFRYELMAEICYKCGRIRHDKSSCTQTENTALSNGGEMFGPWL